MKQVLPISVICIFLVCATSAEASWLQKFSNFAFKAKNYVTNLCYGKLTTKESKTDQLFYKLNKGKLLNLDPNITIYPNFHYKKQLQPHYDLLADAQTKVELLQQHPWPKEETEKFNTYFKQQWLQKLMLNPTLFAASGILDDPSSRAAHKQYRQRAHIFMQSCKYQWIKHYARLAKFEQQYIDDVKSYNVAYKDAFDEKFYGNKQTSRLIEK